jgi:hypothetical protein
MAFVDYNFVDMHGTSEIVKIHRKGHWEVKHFVLVYLLDVSCGNRAAKLTL